MTDLGRAYRRRRAKGNERRRYAPAPPVSPPPPVDPAAELIARARIAWRRGDLTLAAELVNAAAAFDNGRRPYARRSEIWQRVTGGG